MTIKGAVFCFATAVVGFGAISNAADVSMTAANAINTSGFNAATGWNNSLAPSPGNAYFNAGFLLRTPPNAASYTFQGDSLTITGAGLATGVNNEALMWKGTGTTSIISVNNLIINGGQLRHGQGTTDSFTLAGNLTVGSNGANMGTQGGMTVAADIAGTATIRILDKGNTDVGRLITFSSGGNTFTGDIQMFGGASNTATLALADNANLNFVIGSSGVNNRVYGTGTVTYAGDFFFDLTGAGSTIGDSWAVSSPTVQSYGPTFTVNSFTDVGGDLWEKFENGVTYQFAEGTGTLSVVPEPAAFGLLAIGLAASGAALRRRAAR